MPVARMPREDMFLPVTAQTVVSIPGIGCIGNIVSTPNNVSIAEFASGISLVPHVCDSGISAVRESRDTIPLINRYSGEWTRTGNPYSILVDRMLREGSRSG